MIYSKQNTERKSLKMETVKVTPAPYNGTGLFEFRGVTWIITLIAPPNPCRAVLNASAVSVISKWCVINFLAFTLPLDTNANAAG